MRTLQTENAATARLKSRTVLVSFLGAIVRKLGNWMPIAGTVDLMNQVGLDGSSVRTAVFRLTSRGWLVSESRGDQRGYALTRLALDALAEGDQIIWHARQPAALGEGWCVVSFSIPESARSMRHQLRSQLSALGFGNVGNALWIAPARMQRAAITTIEQLDLTDHCAVFVGDHAGGEDLSSLIARAWDLEEIDMRYREFIELWQPEVERLSGSATIDGGDAFVTYLRTVDDWRKLPFRDPGLPVELLHDGWKAPLAGSIFERLVAQLEGRALAHAASVWSPGR